jgi:hypothetical protein
VGHRAKPGGHPLKAPVSSGYTIRKTITPVEQKTAGAWSRGDVYRVRLDLSAQADRLGGGRRPDSRQRHGAGQRPGPRFAAADGRRKSTGWVWPTFEERAFDAFRAYYAFVPKGNWSVEYTVRLNNAGDFSLPPRASKRCIRPKCLAKRRTRT